MAVPAITYRILTEDDSHALQALGVASLPNKYEFSFWQKVANTSNEEHYTVGAFSDDQLIGAVVSVRDVKVSYIAPYFKEREIAIIKRYGKVSYISILIVKEDFRRQGIATNLIRDVINQLETDGAELIYLHVMVSNRSAISLYEKLGFTKAVELQGYYSQLRENAFLYIRARRTARCHISCNPCSIL